jgi:hypothetical protein
MQCTPFRVKSTKNDLKSTNFLKCNFYFEMEEVSFSVKLSWALSVKSGILSQKEVLVYMFK